jgi:hypothetical protein
MTKDKSYQVTVYRTVQQSVEVTVYSNLDLDTLEEKYLRREDIGGYFSDRELEEKHLRREAEDLAGDFSDYEWKNEEVDQMFASEIKAEE